MKKIYNIIVLVFLLFPTLNSCEKTLDEELFSELGSSNYLTTEEGVNTILNGAYSFINKGPQTYMYTLLYSMLSTGIGQGQGGVFEQTTAVPIGNFVWNTTTPFLITFWSDYYEGIRNTNIVIDALKGNSGLSSDFVATRKAEAKALRAYFYYQLYMLYGPVPIFSESAPDSLIKPRATEEEIQSFIENDLLEAIGALPSATDEFGRVVKGGAQGLLCKFYLNTKQWNKCIDVANDIIASGTYSLLPNYANIYDHENERHSEILWSVQQLSDPNSLSTNIIAILSPPDFPLPQGQISYAARNYVFDDFVNSFDDNDLRRDLIVTSYINKSGEEIQGLGNDQSLFFKYPIDPNAAGDTNGIDYIAIRYADILLSLAEALNEVNGPNAESIGLINQIRERAGIEPILLSDFSSTEELREHILNERLWEFYLEGKEREDMIRHGVFIERAISRGINAKEFHVLFPIPQREVDANSEIAQNPGY